METKTITMIAAEALHPHPQNPRKDLGDLQELSDSIRENGVLQNLTVVPHEDKPGQYTVIIGHRRLAAAQLAGLTSLPCIITQMSQADQVKTMLMENMQRTDLTPLEQADGFQLMLDLGVPLQEISDDSGFSTSTIRRRLKLRELDRQILEERILSGATLMDLAELEQLDDPKVRDKVLATVGTNNFQYELQRALSTQKAKNNKPLWIEAVEKFARKLTKEEADSNLWRYRGYHNFASDLDQLEVPDDADTVEYGYKPDSTSVMIYSLRPNADEVEEKNSAIAERKANIQKAKEALDESTTLAYELRLNFVREHAVLKKHQNDAVSHLLKMLVHGYSPSNFNSGAMEDLLKVPEEVEGWSERKAARQIMLLKMLEQEPSKAMLYIAYSVFADSYENDYVSTPWNSFPVYYENPKLDALYDFLEMLGYQISDEERLLMSGEHPGFQPGKDEAALENMDEEAADD